MSFWAGDKIDLETVEKKKEEKKTYLTVVVGFCAWNEKNNSSAPGVCSEIRTELAHRTLWGYKCTKHWSCSGSPSPVGSRFKIHTEGWDNNYKLKVCFLCAHFSTSKNLKTFIFTCLKMWQKSFFPPKLSKFPGPRLVRDPLVGDLCNKQWWR